MTRIAQHALLSNILSAVVGDKHRTRKYESPWYQFGFLTCIVPYVPNASTFPRYDSVKGAPMCDCIENMPVVSRADCTTYSPKGLEACEKNDLRTHYYNEMRRPGGNIRFNLVETCDNKKGR